MAHRLIASALTLGLAAALAPAAFAAPSEDSRSVEVGLKDLNLTTDQGVARLERRIRYAATQVCGAADPRALAEMRRATACRKDAVAGTADAVQLAIAAARSGADYAANGVSVRQLRAAD